MEIPWFIIFLTLCICYALKYLLNLIYRAVTTNNKASNLPPGPPRIPLFTELQWFRLDSTDFERSLLSLRSKYGPILNLKIGRRNAVFIANHDLAHKVLIQNGVTFADRPATEAGQVMSTNQHSINAAGYGPLWRLLRRNLTSEILHSSRIKSYTDARKWMLDILKNKLHIESESDRPVRVMDHFQYAMFCLLVFMCFGEKLEEKVIREIERAERDILLEFTRFSIFGIFPKLSKIIFRNRWSKFYERKSKEERVLIPIITARKEKKLKTQQCSSYNHDRQLHEESFGEIAYVDTLLDLVIPRGNGGTRKLNDQEMVSLCSEFLNAGTDTTSTALQWTMANLVKHQEIQERLFNEITSNTNSDGEIEEEDLPKVPYLRAVVLEALRLHPPGHFVLPHATTEDATIEGYVIPRGTFVNFFVAEIGRDPNVWEDPMAFKPERFLSLGNGGAGNHEGEIFDMTGSREIKMMPFGAGRRICPGMGLAMLHLEYFVANLIKEFKWTARMGDDVDLSEKQEFTVVMKHPLCAHISPRIAST